MDPSRAFPKHNVWLALVAAALASFTACGLDPDSLVLPELTTCDGPASTDSLRVMSFNIRAGLSSSIERIGDLIAASGADVVALQEVDVGVARSGGVDQASVLADRIDGAYVFAQTTHREGGAYGIALLSRLPLSRVERIDLDAVGAFERRVAIDADVCLGGKTVRVVSTHADIFPWSGEKNVRDIVEVVGGAAGHGLVIAGDLNATPEATAPRELAQLGLVDVVGQHAEGPTFLDGGQRRIDFVFADGPLAHTSAAQRLPEALSDHLAIVADLSVGELD